MAEEIVRVVRVLEYVGSRAWIDQTLSRSYVQTKKTMGNGSIEQIAIGEIQPLQSKQD